MPHSKPQVTKAYIRFRGKASPKMYNPQVAKEARDFMNYTYIAMIVCGALMVLGALSSLLTVFGWGFFIGFAMGYLIEALVLGAVGAFGVYTALYTVKPKILDKIDQGKYQEAYAVSSSGMTLIVAFITGIIPGILLILGNQKLTSITGGAGAAAPPPPPA